MEKVKTPNLVNVLFFTNDYVNDDSDEKNIDVKPSSYLQGLENDVESSIKTENNKVSKNSGGMKKKYEAPTIEIKEMTPEKLDEMRKKLEKDNERI